MTAIRTSIVVLLITASATLANGCIAGNLIGGMMQNAEYQKQIEVLPQYTGLENRSVAVVVQADLSTLYEYPDLVTDVIGGVSGRLAREVPGARVLEPRIVVEWQLRTPQWDALPYGDICAALGVERVVFIDIYEYRLNPPGNRWVWEGTFVALVSLVEADGIDPDYFADTYTVQVTFPHVPHLTKEEATESQVTYGLRAEFIKQTAWLFHEHLEPKYPDKFRPELLEEG